MGNSTSDLNWANSTGDPLWSYPLNVSYACYDQACSDQFYRSLSQILCASNDWKDLVYRASLANNVTYLTSHNITSPQYWLWDSPIDMGTNTTIADYIVSTCPRLCSIVYGNGSPDVTGIGVFIGYMIQIWLTSLIFVVLPIVRQVFHRKLDNPSETTKTLLEGYRTLLTTTFSANMVFAIFNSSATIHELHNSPALLTHYYLHVSNIVSFCMASITFLSFLYSNYQQRELTSASIVGTASWFILIGVFVKAMVLDDKPLDGAINMLAEACLQTRQAVSIPGLDISWISVSLWQSSSAFWTIMGWIMLAVLGCGGLLFLLWLFALMVDSGVLDKVIDGLQWARTRILNMLGRSRGHEGKKSAIREKMAPMEKKTEDLVVAKLKAHGNTIFLCINTLIFLAWAIPSTILLTNIRRKTLEATQSEDNVWFFGQYAAAAIWLPIFWEACRVGIDWTIEWRKEKKAARQRHGNVVVHSRVHVQATNGHWP